MEEKTQLTNLETIYFSFSETSDLKKTMKHKIYSNNKKEKE